MGSNPIRSAMCALLYVWCKWFNKMSYRWFRPNWLVMMNKHLRIRLILLHTRNFGAR